jgi:hypothetical protein
MLLTSYHIDLFIISLQDARGAAYESTIWNFLSILIVMKNVNIHMFMQREIFLSHFPLPAECRQLHASP